MDPFLLNAISDCKYNPIMISDHAPVSMTIKLPSQRPRRTWRLDPLLLADDVFVQFVSEQIDIYLDINMTDDISASTLWEALKAYLRGQIIAHSAYTRKVHQNNITDLSSRIKALDSLISSSPTPDRMKARVSLQTEADLLLTTEAERLIFKSRSRFYEEGDKPSKLLASQLRQKAASHVISQIRLPDGVLSEDHQTINNNFKEFYSKLYSSDLDLDQQQFDTFFCNLNIPTIDSDTEEKLEQPITIEEIITAITSLQSGKAPGPDGFPNEFYKKFKEQLAPLLLSVYKESVKKSSPTHTPSIIHHTTTEEKQGST